MNPPNNQTQMTNPPKSEAKLKAPYPVKIQARTEIRLMRGDDGRHEVIVRAGDVANVTEEEASEFCDQRIETNGRGGHAGYTSTPKIFVTRAERVK